ncbi:hypothetical protein ACFV0G_39610, partial [Kitasatospora sp. NPDC059571]
MTIPSGRTPSNRTGTAVLDGAGRRTRRARLALARARERGPAGRRRLMAAHHAGGQYRGRGDRAGGPPAG